MDRVEDFIWGRVDESEYLESVVADDTLDSEQLLLRVEGIQRNLNVRLRQGVEENYPRLLEQVSAIETLDVKQAHFDEEMKRVARQAQQFAELFSDSYAKLKHDVTTIRHLTLLNRLLIDALRCDDLVTSWNAADENDQILRCAETVNELNALLNANEKLRQLKWLMSGALSRIADLRAKTRTRIVGRLRDALSSLSCSDVSLCLKALVLLYADDSDSGRVFALQLADSTQTLHPQAQKELNDIMMESVRDLETLFSQLCATISNSGANDKSATKFLLQIGNRLHAYLEQYQLLGIENAQAFGRHVGKIIAARSQTILGVPSLALRLLQTVYKCMATHPDSVTRVIREALTPLKLSILSQSLSALFSAVDAAFAPQEVEDFKSVLIVEKLNSIMRTELQNVSWDVELHKEMESSVAKTLRYVGTKIEQQLHINADTLQLSGRISRQQFANYQMLNIAHNFVKHWPQAHLSQSLGAIIAPSIDALLTTMRSTVSLVLASMHSEKIGESLPATATSSLYMKELCNHLKVFRAHVAQIEPLVESVEALPNFLNYVIEQLSLHSSLVRPISTGSVERFRKDLEYLCRVGLQPFNCKTAKLLNGYANIIEFFQKCADFSKSPDELAQCAGRLLSTTTSGDGGGCLPAWLVVNLLINVSGDELPLPHESAGWQLQTYVDWFNIHADTERFSFYRNLLVSYRQTVMARGATEFATLYPTINEIVESNLPQ